MRLRRLILLGVCAAGVGLAGLYERFEAPLRFWINKAGVELFCRHFSDAIPFGREIGINGLTAQRGIPGHPSYFFEANLDLAYRPSRTSLTVQLIEQIEPSVRAVRNELTFRGTLKSEILRGSIDYRLFEKYPSAYPAASPVPWK